MIYDLRTGEAIGGFGHKEHSVHMISSYDTQRIILFSEGELSLYHLRSKPSRDPRDLRSEMIERELLNQFTLAAHEEFAGAVFTQDEKRILSITRTGKLMLWDLDDGALLCAAESKAPHPVGSVLAIAPDGSRVLSASNDGPKLWQLTHPRQRP